MTDPLAPPLLPEQQKRLQELADKRAESHARANEAVANWILAAALGTSAFGLNAALTGDKSWLLFASAIGFALSGLLIFATGLATMRSAVHFEASQSWLQEIEPETVEEDFREHRAEYARGLVWDRRAVRLGTAALVALALGMGLMIADYGIDLAAPEGRSIEIKIQ